jgi:polysaccharide biosynthesis protein PslG
MLRAAYGAVKQADPNATVINGGLADASNASSYLTSLYLAGAKSYFDVLSQHV